MTSAALPLPARSSPVRSIAVETAWTLSAVITLVLMGKGIAAIGSALSLPNACWQLLALRAAAGALVVASLTRFDRGQLTLFGVLYAAALMLSHTSLPLFLAATVAGVLAAAVRWAMRGTSLEWLRTLVTTVVFITVLASASLYRKMERSSTGTALGEWGFDLLIRMTGVVAAVALVALVVSLITRRNTVGVGR